VVIVAVIVLTRCTAPGEEPATTEAAAIETVTAAPTPPTYYFNSGDGTPVMWQEMTDAWAREAGYEKRYELTDAERWEIASVITAEAVGEPYAGKVAVAQCVLQMCEDEGIRPAEVFARYGYSKRRPEPSWESLEAVQAVFDFGQVATSEPIKYFYAPALVSGEWHETQVYVLTINGHKFFKEATDE
jgi:spore germination cell wall hydrolase CwlJ-like protein